MALSVGNDQIPAANGAADAQHGPFNDDFVEIKQTHNVAKSGVWRAFEQKIGTNAVGVG
ncbi:hypothetical protein [Dyadobacter jiangsuensis]|uniref:hypothetical protein n=1 Tax=Dyadobacter jiangsuensis TaxID=1591085 RepID=UPI0014758A23|nr:hypothetical protein [Dyadobacter jiangsuensis]